MTKSNKSIKELTTQAPLIGKVDWIGLRKEKRGEVLSVGQVTVSEAEGLIGDHYARQSDKRQVTLIQTEHLQAVATMLGKERIDPGLTRRNIAISGINLLAFKELQFRLGNEVVLEMTGLCHPCSRMEENLGEGGYHAMRGHGGITARVVRGGTIRVGDKVQLLKL